MPACLLDYDGCWKILRPAIYLYNIMQYVTFICTAHYTLGGRQVLVTVSKKLFIVMKGTLWTFIAHCEPVFRQHPECIYFCVCFVFSNGYKVGSLQASKLSSSTFNQPWLQNRCGWCSDFRGSGTVDNLTATSSPIQPVVSWRKKAKFCCPKNAQKAPRCFVKHPSFFKTDAPKTKINEWIAKMMGLGKGIDPSRHITYWKILEP